MEEYIVQCGDTLSSIAVKKLGDKNRWREIAQLNNLQNANELLVGQRLKLPNSKTANQSNIIPNQNLNISLDTSNQQIPATIIPARGLMFVVFEQLPEVGSKNVVRKVAVVPKDYSLLPRFPQGNLTPAEHALNLKPNLSQFLSASENPFGSPSKSKFSIESDGWKELLLIDTSKVQANGTRIFTVDELVLDLRRHAVQNPDSANQVNTLIKAIQNFEGEVLIEGGVPGDAVKKISTAHTIFAETADEIVRNRKAGLISEVEMNGKLANLTKTYEKAKIFGKVGRVITVIGVVFTAADVANAAQKSYNKRSYKPLAAETVRQIGGWSGAYTGGLVGIWAGGASGAWLGGLFGIELGPPGVIIGGTAGTIIFGAIGYWRGDVLAGLIDPPEEMATNLRKDVNYFDDAKNIVVELTVGANKTQYDFCHRALEKAAIQAQRTLLINSDTTLPNRFATKFFPANQNTDKKNQFKMIWENSPAIDKNKNKILDSEEWKSVQGRKHFYHLIPEEIDKLIKMMSGNSR